MSCSHKKSKMKILDIRFIFLYIPKTRNHFRDKAYDDGKSEERAQINIKIEQEIHKFEHAKGVLLS